jgi:hypothetical protein
MLLVIVALLASLLSLSCAQNFDHAHCGLTWQATVSCSKFIGFLAKEITAFSCTVCQEKNYTMVARTNTTITALHTTPVAKYVDDLSFTATQSGASCSVDAFSISRTLSLYDYSTNFCSLFNLMRAFPSTVTYTTTLGNDQGGCPWHDQTMCDKY